MRREKDLADSVDVHSRTIAAKGRVRSNGRQHHALHVPEAIVVDDVTLWERFKNALPQPEVLEVAGRAVKGLVVPHWAAGVILAALLSIGWAVYSQISAQRDMLIRLDTQLQERDKHELEYRQEFKNKLNLQQLQIENMTKNVDVIRAMLTPQQLRMLERKEN